MRKFVISQGHIHPVEQPNTYEKEFDNSLPYILYFIKIDTMPMVR